MRLGKWSDTPSDSDRTITNPLKGGEFSLKLEDAEGNVKEDLGTYKSGPNGYISILYDYEIGEDNVYVLTEEVSPKGYTALSEPVKFYIDDEEVYDETTGVTKTFRRVYLKNPDTDGWVNRIIRNTESDLIADINVYNPTYRIEAVKFDMNNPACLLAKAEFALFRQVESSDGSYIKDYYPLAGYEKLETGDDGLIPKIDESLPAGVYYLTETKAPNGYDKLSDIKFAITETGMVKIVEAPSGVNLKTTEVDSEGTGKYTFSMNVPNTQSDGYNLTISKTVTGNMGSKAKDFSFGIRLTDGGQPETPISGTFAIEGSGDSITFNEEGYATLTLTHGETLKILKLPSGAKVTISEDDYSSDGYVVSSLLTKKSDNTTKTEYIKDEVILDTEAVSKDTNGVGATFVLDEELTVEFINKRQGFIPTGIFMGAAVLIGAAVIIIAGIVINLKRGKKLKNDL